MNKIKICVVYIMIIFINILYAQNQRPAQKEWLQDQHDQTDVFGIPLDSSETEEEAEEKELNTRENKRN